MKAIKKSKTIYKTDHSKICLNIYSGLDLFIDLEGKWKSETKGKWELDFRIEFRLYEKPFKYFILERFIDPYDGRQTRDEKSYIIYNNKELLEKIPLMKQEYIDIAIAAYINELMIRK